MKTLHVTFFAIVLLASPGFAETTVQVRAGTSGFEFGFLYSDHYHTEESVVVHATEQMDEQDLIVALHLARLSGVELQVIVDWRRSDLSWFQITQNCHLHTDVYSVDLGPDPGPPYGRAIGHWKKHPKQDIALSDDEIRAFTVLRAMSEYTGQPATQILAEQRQGHRPVDIATAAGKARHGHTEDAASPVPPKKAGKANHESHGKKNKKKK